MTKAKTAITRLLGLPFYIRQRKLARSRPPMTEAAFVTSIVDAGGDAAAAIAAWKVLTDRTLDDGLSPYPEDSLGSIYGLAEEDLDEDLILPFLNDHKIAVPSQDAIAAFGPIDSTIRLAQFISFCRKLNR